jgi:hypothetical protein
MSAPKVGRVRAKGRHIDWTALRARFVASDGTLREFGEAEGVSWSALSERSSKEGWVAAREAHRTKVAASALAARAKDQSATEAEIDGLAHAAALKLARKLVDMIDGVEEPTQAKDVAKALADTHRLARITAHLPAEPVPTVAKQELTIVVRGVDENDQPTEDDLGEADRRPVGLPTEPVTGEAAPGA